MKRWLNGRVTLALAAALAAAVVLAAAEPAAEAPEDTAQSEAPVSEGTEDAAQDTTPAGWGLRVYLDPETGRMVSRPTDPEGEDVARGLDRDRLNTYSRDLVQERLPGGGFKVDLRGRFRTAVVATIDPETDEVTIDCLSTAATEEANDES